MRSPDMVPTDEEHQLLLQINPELARRGSNSLYYGWVVKHRGRQEALGFKRAQEMLAIIRPLLEERDRLCEHLETLRDMTRHIPDPQAASSVRAQIDEALLEVNRDHG